MWAAPVRHSTSTWKEHPETHHRTSSSYILDSICNSRRMTQDINAAVLCPWMKEPGLFYFHSPVRAGLPISSPHAIASRFIDVSPRSLNFINKRLERGTRGGKSMMMPWWLPALPHTNSPPLGCDRSARCDRFAYVVIPLTCSRSSDHHMWYVLRSTSNNNAKSIFNNIL